MSRSYGEKDRIIGANGRVHLPSWVRTPLGIKKGDKVDFKVDFDKKEITITPSK